MDTEIPEPTRDHNKPFILSIDQWFIIEGRGVVATGSVEGGKVKVGDEVEIIGYKRNFKKTTITGVEMFNKSLDFAQAGDDSGLLLRGIEKTDIKRGMLICKPGLFTDHRNCTAEVYVLDDSEGERKIPFFTKYLK